MLKKKISHILSFLSMLIVAAIVITSLPVNVLANDANGTISTAKNPEEEIKFDSGSVVESPATDFEYTIEDSKVTITKYIGSATEVVIPGKIEEYPVTSIGGYAFVDCTSLTSITIPKGVTFMGEGAFFECTSLTSITIPEGVTSIESATFFGCESLTSITIPEGVTRIESDAFRFCAFTSITIPKGVTFMGEGAFYGCKSLTSITIPERVSISDWTFGMCSSLTSITILERVTSIGDRAFWKCYSLTDVYYTGTETQWDNIYIGDNNDDLLNATIHFNYVSTVIPDEITPSVGSNVVVDSDKSTVSGISAESKPADVIAQFEGSDNIQIVGKDGKALADDALVGTGCKIQLVENGEVKDEVTVVIKGEIDGNGKIDSDDAIYLLRNTLFASLYPVVAEDDVDGNGGYNSDDAIHLLRHTLFPTMYPLK